MNLVQKKKVIPRKDQHDSIVEELGLKIVSGQYPQNEKLPSIDEICKNYKISRTVAREVIRVLNSKGLTYSRPRVGTVVNFKDEWHLLDPDVLSWVMKSTPKNDFFETFSTVRRVLEPELAYIAANTATDEDIRKIQSAYKRMEEASTLEDSMQPDIDFHIAIAEATHNEILIYISKMLVLSLQYSIQVTNLRPNDQEHSLPRHKAILTAIENKDSLSARHASLVQLEDTKEAYASVL
ncbi:FadR/GntR family transcriptional regulator [Psychrobacter sanguinis]|uniref:FCD domain-containing protein n=1 Tax=Psychrobacter sanguinis TaxID=861445 RepID=A0A844M3B2_9GAMM|nr:FadR/GntR family transcriptional regulator [Psychrobacter sanguinis]MUG33462.1 FCD domain-containing protein [Psychrobacter sanguinis]